MKAFLKLLAVAFLGMFSTLAHAADYTDVGAAVTAVGDIPDTVKPVYFAFLTLAIGAITIAFVVRWARRGSGAK